MKSGMNKIKMMKRIVLLIITTLCLTGCGIYSNYTRPDDLKSFGIYDDKISTETDSVRISWEDIFLDPYLRNLINKGLENNSDLNIALLQCKEAEASLRAAKWAFVPSLSFTPQGTINQMEGSSPTYSYEIPVSASWQLDIFGSLRNAKRRVQAQLERSKEYADAVRTQLTGNIAAYYYKLILLDNQLDVYNRTAENWRDNIEVTKRLMTAGQYNDAAVAQSEANYYNICSLREEIEQQIKETENGLSLLTGDTLKVIERGKTRGNNIVDFYSDGIPLSLLSMRPDVRQSEMVLASYFYSTCEARSAFYPSLTLNGTAGWSNSAGGIIVNPANWIWTAIESLTQPLLQQKKLSSQLKIAQAQQEEAKLSYQQTLLKAGTEVNNALSQIQSYRKRADYCEMQVQSLERAVSSTSALMRHGSVTYLEVLTAQQSLLSAQLTQLNNSYNEIVAVINLYQAL